MKKFIKINLIILVIVSLSCFMPLSRLLATSERNFDFLTVPEDAEENSTEEIIDGNLEETQTEESNEDVEEEQAEEEDKTLDDLQLEKGELEMGIDTSSAQIQFIESELSATVSELVEINQNIHDKQLEIQCLQVEEQELVEYIKKAERELEDSNKRYEKQKKLLEQRLVAMYQMGEVSYLKVLVNSKGITNFLTNFYLIEEVARADAELLNTVEAEQKYNKKLKDTLETKKAILTASKDTREKNAIALANMNIIKNNKLKTLNNEEEELHRKIEEYQNEIANIEKEIRLLALASVSEEYVGGIMDWPVPGYTRITSSFGMRTHPITGIYKLHTGTDIGAPMGADFIAANDGLVTYAGYNGAYGNMVILDHGGGITTLYAHGSQILVSVGDTVSQGTPILKVGSTGYSTGPHAHFEVRIKGQYVEPLDYITSYSTGSIDESVRDNLVVELDSTTDEE